MTGLMIIVMYTGTLFSTEHMFRKSEDIRGIKMQENDKLQLFEDQPIRTAWDEENEEWYFSIVDVVSVLTESVDYNTGRKYWNKLKQRMKNEGNELVTNCHQLKRKIYAII